MRAFLINQKKFYPRKSSFLRNIVEEIRPGFRNLQMSLVMSNLSEIFLVGMLRNTGCQS